MGGNAARRTEPNATRERIIIGAAALRRDPAPQSPNLGGPAPNVGIGPVSIPAAKPRTVPAVPGR